MTVYVRLKSIGKITKNVKKDIFFIENKPSSLRAFICECVRTCLKLHREKNKESSLRSPLSQIEYEEMKYIGKFAFGLNYNQNDISDEKAIKIAIDAFNDGLVRIFKADTELCCLDEELDVSEGDEFTFVKLTMLSGRMW
ncbi:MAG: hypothetical protein E7675_07615 [Ruminococcaceae bacterium]|nr:hypothetical protein [Oscillospiraceae bacterium]